MSAAPYAPTPNSLAGRLIAHLKQAARGTILTPAEITEALGGTERNVCTLLRPSVRAGLLVHERIEGRGRSRCYSLPEADQPEEEEEPQEQTGPLDIQHFSDGDLVFSGATVGEGDRVLLKPHQLLQLVEFATNTPQQRARLAAAAAESGSAT
jgi:hypothetical protein